MPVIASRPRWAALLLCGWTLFSWITRLLLAWRDDALGAGEKVLATVPVLVFVVLGSSVAMLVGSRRPAVAPATLVLAVWSLVYWAIRLPLVLLADHPLAFDLVHSVLALVAVTLSVAAGRSVLADRGSPSRPPRSRPRRRAEVDVEGEGQAAARPSGL